MNDLMKMNLQFFADPEGGGNPDDNPGAGGNPETGKGKEVDPPKEKDEAKYTDEDLNQIINKKFAELESRKQKELEIKLQEAEKLQKMNADEKANYEREQLQKQLEEYKRKDAFYSLSKEASKMLSEHDIQADDDLLEFVVKDDAEATKQAVDSFVTMFNRRVQEGVKQALSGSAPKVHSTANNALTKKDILAEKDAAKRIRLIQENPNLFK